MSRVWRIRVRAWRWPRLWTARPISAEDRTFEDAPNFTRRTQAAAVDAALRWMRLQVTPSEREYVVECDPDERHGG